MQVPRPDVHDLLTDVQRLPAICATHTRAHDVPRHRLIYVPFCGLLRCDSLALGLIWGPRRQLWSGRRRWEETGAGIAHEYECDRHSGEAAEATRP